LATQEILEEKNKKTLMLALTAGSVASWAASLALTAEQKL